MLTRNTYGVERYNIVVVLVRDNREDPLPLFLCFALLRGCFYLNLFVSSEFVLGVLCPVDLRGWLCLSERGGR